MAKITTRFVGVDYPKGSAKYLTGRTKRSLANRGRYAPHIAQPGWRRKAA